MAACSGELEFFRMLNRLVEPHIRAGWGSPRLVPGGIVVLETKGRRTGRRHRVPLAAIRVQGHTVVSTFRGRRSQWVKNVAADSQVRYWLGGRAKEARAFVIAPGRRLRDSDNLPPVLRLLLSFLVPYTHAGWAFAVLSPSVATLKKGAGARPRKLASRGPSSPGTFHP